MERFTKLDDLQRQVWNLLFRATIEHSSPMRTPALATKDDRGIPRVRTVVLRKSETEKRSLYYFTDIRSDKCRELEHQPQASALFWDPRRHIQLRCTGQIDIHHGDDEAAVFWHDISKHGRKAYATQQAPGTPLSTYTTGLPDNWSELDIAATESYQDNFALLVHRIEGMDALHLERDGHQRAEFHWESNQWRSSWVVP